MTRPAPRGGVAALVAVGVTAAFSAFWRLGQSDWKLDEDAYAQAGWFLVHDGIDTNHGHPPLAKLLFGVSQVAFGRNLTSVRAVAAVGFLASVALLFVLGRQMAGWWTGVAAAGLFAVLPRSMVVAGWSVADLRIDRYALLEAVSGPLILAGLTAGWQWVRRGGWRWAAATGALIGLAGAAQLNSLVVLVSVLVVGVAFGWGRERLAGESGVVLGAAIVGFLVPFAVFGTRAAHQVGEVLRFPTERANEGHLLALGTDVYDRSPWWANLRYVWDADGPWLVAAVLVGLVLAVLSRRRAAVVYLLAATGGLMASAMASPIALPHYRAAWIAPLVLLIAIGVVDHLTAEPASTSAVVLRGVAGATLAVLAVAGALTMARLATLPEGDYHQLADQAQADGVRPTKVLIYSESVAPYFPGAYDALAPFDDGSQPAQLVVLDPSLTDAVDAATVERWRDWARGWGLSPHRVGRLEGWWATP